MMQCITSNVIAHTILLCVSNYISDTYDSSKNFHTDFMLKYQHESSLHNI